MVNLDDIYRIANIMSVLILALDRLARLYIDLKSNK